MKKIFLLCFFIPSLIQAQNVGIGTTTPTGKLEIHHRSSTLPGIKLVDSTTSFGGVIEFRNMNFTNGMKISGFSTSNFNNGQYLDIRSDSIGVMTVKGNGFVGIRDLEPSYPLDVQGDINTNGSLRANGNAGTNGQVLQSNGNGTMSWVDMCEYKNYETFRSAGSSTWTVPAGVTKICVELWGAGGGGAIYGGGGGGGYIKAYFTVIPGSSLSYTIGAGGTGGTFVGSSAGDGGDAIATVGTVTLTAFGGDGSTATVREWPGKGGTFSANAGFRNYTGISGENGKHNHIRYEQKNATTFYVVTKYGDGGNAGNSTNTGGTGNYVITNESTGALITDSYALSPHIPGGGGGTFFCSGCTSSSGAGGQMIIHY